MNRKPHLYLLLALCFPWCSCQLVSNPLYPEVSSSSLISLLGSAKGSARRDECRVRNLKQQSKMSMAKLDAHRCLLRDTVIQVPTPHDLIVHYVQPSHVVLQRCTGLCLDRPGCSCLPKKVRRLSIPLVIGTNASSSSQLCTTIDLDEHRGPCRCKCLISNCHYNQVLDEDQCKCRCRDDLAEEKAKCMRDKFERIWNDDNCQCQCRPRICVEGHYQDGQSCLCTPIQSAVACHNGDREEQESEQRKRQDGLATAAANAPKYIGLTCVLFVGLAILLSLYFVRRRRSEPPISHDVLNTLQRCNTNNRALPSAYTITINETHNALDTDVMMPLTENKTRF